MPITRRKRANPPDQPENNNHAAEQSVDGAETITPPQDAAIPATEENTGIASAELGLNTPFPPVAGGNGDRGERPVGEKSAGEKSEYTPTIEGGRRTSRGELFRRPPQPPSQQSPVPVPAAPASPLEAPTHEITFPLGNLLHLAYNPGYTGSDEARSLLLHQLEHESKAGGRARCWSCGSIAIIYDRWSTRSKTFGEIGVAVCEICGVWSVL